MMVALVDQRDPTARIAQSLRGCDAAKASPDYDDMGQILRGGIVFLRTGARPPVKQPIDGKCAAACDHKHQKKKQDCQPIVGRHGDTGHWHHHRDDEGGQARRTAKRER
ncbi:hypothetical protein KCU90_g2798, partial [Aureobasidium melanogenum]